MFGIGMGGALLLRGAGFDSKYTFVRTIVGLRRMRSLEDFVSDTFGRFAIVLLLMTCDGLVYDRCL